MRLFFIACMLFPFLAGGQINQSANQLAHENIGHYLTTRVFSGKTYMPLYYGPLVRERHPHDEADWSVKHYFSIADSTEQGSPGVLHYYHFTIFLDRYLVPVRAE